LFFATGLNGEEQMAENIRALRRAGCDVIVDDLGYVHEPVFQDGVIARAITEVRDQGALYVTAAGNDGNQTARTSGVWEGDFSDANATPPGSTVKLHRFGTAIGNAVTRRAPFNPATGYRAPLTLKWSDAWGESGNDY